MTREDVIKGMENIVSDMQEEIDEWRDYSDSELSHGLTCDCEWWYSTAQKLKDALALLKEQEPRVMTLYEVKMLDRDYYYLEAMRSPGKELREIVGTYGLECVTWPSITWARQTMGDSGYGKTWRCWTSRPTDTQRRTAMWE